MLVTAFARSVSFGGLLHFVRECDRELGRWAEANGDRFLVQRNMTDQKVFDVVVRRRY